jgi:hypothetical protein
MYVQQLTNLSDSSPEGNLARLVTRYIENRKANPGATANTARSVFLA